MNWTMMKASSTLAECIMYLSMRLVLTPVAFLLPRDLALAVADAVALLLCFFPIPGLLVLAEMERAFNVRKIEAFRLAWGWLARPLRDFVLSQLLIFGRETTGEWKVIEKNPESIDALRNSGESYIIACGHFAREAIRGVYLQMITPGHILQITNPPQAQGATIYNLRISLQLTALLEACRTVHCGNMTLVFAGLELPALRRLYENLCNPGNVAIVNIDAPFSSGGPGYFSRAFIGRKKCFFSMGAILLARLAQCALIGCICWQEDDGSMVIEWGEAIKLPDRGSKDENTKIMNHLLDRFEIAIGRRPTQYVLQIKADRRWNAKTELWEDL